MTTNFLLYKTLMGFNGWARSVAVEMVFNGVQRTLKERRESPTLANGKSNYSAIDAVANDIFRR